MQCLTQLLIHNKSLQNGSYFVVEIFLVESTSLPLGAESRGVCAPFFSFCLDLYIPL